MTDLLVEKSAKITRKRPKLGGQDECSEGEFENLGQGWRLSQIKIRVKYNQRRRRQIRKTGRRISKAISKGK